MFIFMLFFLLFLLCLSIWFFWIYILRNKDKTMESMSKNEMFFFWDRSRLQENTPNRAYFKTMKQSLLARNSNTNLLLLSWWDFVIMKIGTLLYLFCHSIKCHVVMVVVVFDAINWQLHFEERRRLRLLSARTQHLV